MKHIINYRNEGKHWSPLEKELLRASLSAPSTLDIQVRIERHASRFGRSVDAVKSFAKRNGILGVKSGVDAKESARLRAAHRKTIR